jgi:hypothetical protein
MPGHLSSWAGIRKAVTWRARRWRHIGLFHLVRSPKICTDLVKRGPALGILIMLATQRPDAKSIPTGISANAVLRLCLKVQGQVENDMVLGTSQYKSGIRATMFSFEDKGVAYFAGEGTARGSSARRASTCPPPRPSPPAPGSCASTPAGSPGTRSARTRRPGTPAG